MIFLQPIALVLALLAVGVALLHGRRERRVVVAGLSLWAELARQGAAVSPARAWPRPSLPLALQILALLALVLALARPFWGPEPPAAWIILADDSALTETADLTRALAQVEGRIAPGTPVSLLATDARARAILAGVAMRPGLLRDHAPAAQGQGAPDWDGALALAGALAAEIPGARILFIGAAPAAAPVDAELLSLPRRAAPETVTAAAAPEGAGWRIVGRARAGAALDLRLTGADGGESSLPPVTVDGTGQFALDLAEAAQGELSLAVAGGPPTRLLLDPPAPWRVATDDPVWSAALGDLGAEITEPGAPADLHVLPEGAQRPGDGLALILPGPAVPGPFRVTDWLADHPLIHGLDLPQLTLDAAAPFAPAGDEITLAAAPEGALIAAGPRAIRLGFDPAQGDMADVLPIMLAARVLDWLGPPRGTAAPQCLIGETCRIDRALIGRTLTGPDGAEQAIAGPKAVFRRAGIWTAPGAAVVIVNPAPITRPAVAILPTAGFARDLTPRALGLAALCLLAEAALAWRAGARGGLALRGLAVAAVVLAMVNPVLPAPARPGVPLTVADAPGRDTPAALELAAARLPAGGALTLISRAPPEDLAPALARLAGQGARVAIAPPPARPGDVAILAADAPAAIHAGDRILVAVSLWSASAAAAELSLRAEGEVLASAPVTLAAGANRFDLPVTLPLAGPQAVEVVVAAAGDPTPGNDRLILNRIVMPAPRIAVVSREEGPRAVVAGMLRGQGLDAVDLAPGRLPVEARHWSRHDAVLLLDLPAIALEMRQMDILLAEVQAGRLGLVIAGGPESFGPGGYLETPLETLSPLSARLPHDGPDVAMVFVLDRSGSMTQTVGEISRLDLAKQAVAAAAAQMDPDSGELGVVMFGSDAGVALPLAPAPDAAGVAAGLAQAQPGGGTNIYPGLVLALDELRRSSAGARHIVVMTDGMSDEADFPGLLAAIRAEGITVSSVAIGSTAETNIAEDIALLGGGRFHSTRDFAALPAILAQETLMLRGETIEAGALPVVVEPAAAAVLPGLTPPPVAALVQTTLQEGATALWLAERPDDAALPLLAEWRVGAGRVAALATALTGRWTPDWQADGVTPALAAGLLRHVLPAALAPVATRRGDLMMLTLPPGATASVNGQPLTLRPAALGQTATLPIRPEGAVIWREGPGEGPQAVAAPGAIPLVDSARDHSPALAAAVPAPTAVTPAARVIALAGALTALALILFLCDLARRYGLGPAALRPFRKARS